MLPLVLGHQLELAAVLVYLEAGQPATILPDPEVLAGVASPFSTEIGTLPIIPAVVETGSN